MFFSKFIWADWLLDQPLRRCSPEARALWLDMLALSARSEPIGVLADGDTEFGVADIARAAGIRKETAARLIAELERNAIFSRDDRGRIYSRRLVREHSARERNKAFGKRGGNPQLVAKNTPVGVNPHKLEVKSQESEVTSQRCAVPEGASDEPAKPEPVTASPQQPPRPSQLPRAVAAMGTTFDALHRKTGWMAFDYAFANWVEEGADPERDIWPVIEALSAKLGRVPASPAYFTGAIRDARDRRKSFAVPAPQRLGAPYLATSAIVAPTAVDPQLAADRLAAFERTGAWSSHWGPKPEEGRRAVGQ
jgi:hypothetical protein